MKEAEAHTENGAAIQLRLLAPWLSADECGDAVESARVLGSWIHPDKLAQVVFRNGRYSIRVA